MCPEKFQTAKERNAWSNDIVREISRLLIDGFTFGVVKEIEQPGKELVPLPITVALQNILNIARSTLSKKTNSSYQSVLNKYTEYYTDKLTPSADHV